jgi:ubiquinone biosynthesis protein Coq4
LTTPDSIPPFTSHSRPLPKAGGIAWPKKILWTLQALFLLVRGFLRLARAKTGYDLIAVKGAFDFADAEVKLSLYDVPLEYLESDPATRNQADRLHGLETRFTPELLGACPEGSLGWVLKKRILDVGLDPEFYRMCYPVQITDRRQWFSFRTRQVHDLLHLVTGYPPTHMGEIAIFTFLGANLNSYSPYLIAIAGVAGQLFKKKTKLMVINNLFARAWLQGGSIRPILGINFEELLNKNLFEVREKLGIPRYGLGYSHFPLEKLDGYDFRELEPQLEIVE